MADQFYPQCITSSCIIFRTFLSSSLWGLIIACRKSFEYTFSLYSSSSVSGQVLNPCNALTSWYRPFSRVRSQPVQSLGDSSVPSMSNLTLGLPKIWFDNRRMKNQLDATYFIVLLIGSKCYELATMMLITTLVVSFVKMDGLALM